MGFRPERRPASPVSCRGCCDGAPDDPAPRRRHASGFRCGRRAGGRLPARAGRRRGAGRAEPSPARLAAHHAGMPRPRRLRRSASVRPFSFAMFADDVLAAADQAGLDRFVAGGISMGAAIALRLACRHPDRVAGAGAGAAGLDVRRRRRRTCGRSPRSPDSSSTTAADEAREHLRAIRDGRAPPARGARQSRLAVRLFRPAGCRTPSRKCSPTSPPTGRAFPNAMPPRSRIPTLVIGNARDACTRCRPR